MTQFIEQSGDINFQFQGVPQASQNKDSEFERKLRERQMAMDERGHIGQKLGGTRGRNRSGSRDRESSRERPPKSASRDNLNYGSQSDLYDRPSSRNERPSSRQGSTDLKSVRIDPCNPMLGRADPLVDQE